jgi:hypothetical protein
MASTVVVLANRLAPTWRTFRSAVPALPPIGTIEITVTPPEYTRKPVATLRDPAEVRAIAGSRLHLRVESGSTAVTLETLDARLALSRDQQGTFAGDVVADHDGYLGIEATSSSTGSPAPLKRLIGLAVDADTSPIVRVTKPGRDLFLATTGEAVPIDVTAEGDLGSRRCASRTRRCRLGRELRVQGRRADAATDERRRPAMDRRGVAGARAARPHSR